MTDEVLHGEVQQWAQGRWRTVLFPPWSPRRPPPDAPVMFGFDGAGGGTATLFSVWEGVIYEHR